MNKVNKDFSTTDISAAWNILQQARHIVLLAHYKPDGDAISSCAALDEILRSYQKKVTTIYPTEAEFTVKHQPENILINNHKEIPDVVISLDASTYNRIYYPDEFKSIPFINIDHHISNELKGTYNFVSTSTSSTCEVLYNLLSEWCPDRISKKVAECLLFGILTDTNRFLWPSTTAQTLQTASFLVDKKRKKMIATMPPSHLVRLKALYQKLKLTNRSLLLIAISAHHNLITIKKKDMKT